jgi:hypothetical protein
MTKKTQMSGPSEELVPLNKSPKNAEGAPTATQMPMARAA